MSLNMLVVQGRPKGKYLHFPPGDYVFGRGQECHIRPNSPWVSRQHCLLCITRKGASIRDLGSRNGTLVNGCPIAAEIQLQTGDKLQIGPLVLQVVEQTVPPDLNDEVIGEQSPPATPDDSDLISSDSSH